MCSKSLFKDSLQFQNYTAQCRFLGVFMNLLQNTRLLTPVKPKRSILRCSRTLFSTNGSSHNFKKTITKQKSDGGKSKTEYLFGVGPCYLALKSNRRKISNIYIRDGAVNTTRNEFEEIRKMAEDKGVPIVSTTRKHLLKLSQGRPAQNIVMEVSPLKFLNCERKDFKSDTETGNPELWVALDEVQDPMNFGAILRTSFLLGVSGVVVPQRNSAPLSPVVSKASAGAMEMMNIFQVSHLPSFLKERANEGWDILGSVSPNSAEESEEKPLDCTNYEIHKTAVLVLGNEGIGLQSQVLQHCTRLISIFPPSLQPSSLVGPDSLNVSVATGILVFSLMKNLVSKSQK
ncbi:rRNA methyltransferase 1, mitochondrial-like isoform X2 [Actinia tenebrosa]|uniref:rRNA methyltransferase 1, mitochondrial n=1 Tax=Actinia tenebrosa TaxID=6105 RepID=A0A6P8HS22_ACTTE|nr:rRNA methyltransferase 1, mitochondrial-like isoform X2 [Actinia tenebrosa]